MRTFLAKVPFLRILFPLLGGILVQYYFGILNWSVPLLFFGLLGMLFSYFLTPVKQYTYRWLFGVCFCVFMFSIGATSTSFRQHHSEFDFSSKKESYKAIIVDVPQTKAKSIACKVRLADSDKEVVCYLQPGVRSRKLQVGDEFFFYGQILPVKQYGDPEQFDYPKYMYNNGLSGTVFLYSDNWEATEYSLFSLQAMALQSRQKLLEFYQTLGLSEAEYSVLSALTLGYKEDIPDNVEQAFRTTGTAHILAVSGMHVAVIFGVIVMLFSVIHRRAKYFVITQLIIIITLWVYAFVIGLPASVVRATIMLSIFSVAQMSGKDGNTYNNISIAAFLMLLYNPFYLFDVGFQLSFLAVISICYFHPHLSKLFTFRKTYLNKFWSFFSLSIAAQLGTFAICLFHFGSFPTYFFVTNLLVIPLVAIIVYVSIALLFVELLSSVLSLKILGMAVMFLAKILSLLIWVMVEVVLFFENLPFASITDVKISVWQSILLTVFLFVLFLFLRKRQPKLLIYSLSLILLMFVIHFTQEIILKQDSLIIYNTNGRSVIKWNVGQNEFRADSIDGCKLILLKDKKLLSVSGNLWQNKSAVMPLNIDYLHIVKNDSISLYSLTQLFSLKNIILDSSLSGKCRRRIVRESEKLGLSCYDMKENGIFRINF